ncbi:hypothetical protein [Nocardia pseudobrasiliensis]|uniref:Uncharacterized protein n=1 Tax=Nocardia pseudobrasiliensis TaxID=45979 RepID=A0A370IDM3_9NOCA|nr:hypothetical protein [Nocardia pseudobrasiliensis]RDI68813.1 hypothetical protein DFR76_101348 [Nocardia pseudobrasiliensis]
MRKQHSTFPTRGNKQRFVTRPVPPRTVTPKGGWARHGRHGAR